MLEHSISCLSSITQVTVKKIKAGASHIWRLIGMQVSNIENKKGTHVKDNIMSSLKMVIHLVIILFPKIQICLKKCGMDDLQKYKIK